MPSYLPEKMTKDPRAYLSSGCNKGSKFLQGLGKLGDIEIESGVLRGLDTLVNITDAGGPKLTGIIDGGANAVMDTVMSPLGFGSQEVNTTLNAINPSAVNTALGSANIIREKMRNRDFTARDIPEVVQDFKSLGNVARNALDLDAINQKVPVDPCKPFTPSLASPFALDLISKGVKYKFNFVVEFKYNKPYNASMSGLGNTFMVKTVRLPQVEFEHVDVNMYNYRTKVPTKTLYQPLDMTFYDDDQNQVLNFYSSYLKTMSPIANRRSSSFMEQGSMDFDNLDEEIINVTGGTSGTHNAHNYSSTLGPISSEIDKGKNTILDRIIIYHVYDKGFKMNVYEIFNPKITSMTLPELDQTASENTELSINAVYDSFYVHTGISTNITESYPLDIRSASSVGGALYPLMGDNEMNGPQFN